MKDNTRSYAIINQYWIPILTTYQWTWQTTTQYSIQGISTYALLFFPVLLGCLACSLTFSLVIWPVRFLAAGIAVVCIVATIMQHKRLNGK